MEISKKPHFFAHFPVCRPLVEAWLNIGNHELVVFVNHWKSGASNPKMEAIRVTNAEVLEERLDVLLEQNPALDFVLAGDFNTEYNQHLIMKNAPKFALRDVLEVTGNEALVASLKDDDGLYNLWYELPFDQRGSEAYRGNLGTLMHLIIPGGLYDGNGIQYVDNSFKIGAFPGLNTYPFAPIPKRWNSFGDGLGFSDHLPVSMEFKVAEKPVMLKNPGIENDENDQKDIAVRFRMPKMDEVYKLSSISIEQLQTEKYFNEYFYCELVLDEKDEVQIGDTTYKIYSETKDIREIVKQAREKNEGLVNFFGRHTLYRTTWEFIIESPEFVLNAN